VLKLREAKVRASNFSEAVDLNLEFHSAIAAACHNSLLEQLNRAISRPLRIALSYTTGCTRRMCSISRLIANFMKQFAITIR